MRKKTKDMLKILFGILLFGSVWGFLEATFGNVLHFLGLWPWTGSIMTSIGVGLIAFTQSTYRIRGIGFAMSVVAASIKALDFLIPGSNVVRPIIAILGIGIAYEGVTYAADVISKARTASPADGFAWRLGSGFAAGYLAIAMFSFATAYILRYEFWLDKGVSGIMGYLFTQGWLFGVLSAFTCAMGFRFLDFTRLRLAFERAVASRAFYMVSSFVIAACWAGGMLL